MKGSWVQSPSRWGSFAHGPSRLEMTLVALPEDVH